MCVLFGTPIVPPHNRPERDSEALPKLSEFITIPFRPQVTIGQRDPSPRFKNVAFDLGDLFGKFAPSVDPLAFQPSADCCLRDLKRITPTALGVTERLKIVQQSSQS